jgi:hypothetical protein
VKEYAKELSTGAVVRNCNSDVVVFQNPATITHYNNNANILHGRFVNYYSSATKLVEMLNTYPQDILGVMNEMKNHNNTGIVHLKLDHDGDIDPVATNIVDGELNMSVFYSHADLWNVIPIDMCMWGMFHHMICHINSLVPGRLTLYVHKPYMEFGEYKAALDYVKCTKDNKKEIDVMSVLTHYSIDPNDWGVTNLKEFITNDGDIHDDIARKFITTIKPTAFSIEGYRYIERVDDTDTTKEEFEP